MILKSLVVKGSRMGMGLVLSDYQNCHPNPSVDFLILVRIYNPVCTVHYVVGSVQSYALKIDPGIYSRACFVIWFSMLSCSRQIILRPCNFATQLYPWPVWLEVSAVSFFSGRPEFLELTNSHEAWGTKMRVDLIWKLPTAAATAASQRQQAGGSRPRATPPPLPPRPEEGEEELVTIIKTRDLANKLKQRARKLMEAEETCWASKVPTFKFPLLWYFTNSFLELARMP